MGGEGIHLAESFLLVSYEMEKTPEIYLVPDTDRNVKIML